jgi:long-chain fatty acid transport protein
MKLKKIAVLVAVAAVSGSALATNGYFSHGYGMKAKGMGGASTAMASDSMGGANNPASMVWAGTRVDAGLDFFAPKRSISRTGGTGAGAGLNGSADSGSNLHYVPEFGFNKMIGTDMSLGVTVYGNGGMNTDYPGGQILGAAGTCAGFGATWANANLLCGNGRLGIDMMQLIVAPTFAMKVNNSNSLGVSLLIGHQQFKASGIQSFAGFSVTPANLSNIGRDKSNGFGLRFGWMGQLNDQLTLGAAYATKMKMSKLDMYKGLFAEEGGFDIPENWNIGIAYKPNDQWKIAADYQRINYGSIKSISNSSVMPLDPGLTNAGIPNSLGCATCRGFGWSDVDVIKLGVEYQYSKDLTLRAGYNHSQNPISSRDVTFNMLAPGVVQDHITLGFTYNVRSDVEVTMAYMHAAKKSVSGSSLFSNFLGGASAGTDKIEMSQDSLGVAVGFKF